MTRPAIRTALISVSDKTDIEPLGRALDRAGIRILSTGGTASALKAAGVPVTEVSEHTGFPEIMGGRIKTLHPKIHGGILARRGEDDGVMAEHGIEGIDLVVINLYPFAETVADPECTLEAGVEQVDIGGPAMLRAAAKNFAHVTVLCDPADYPMVIDKLPAGPDPELRRQLAAKAFAHTSDYDAQITSWLSTAADARLPPGIELSLEHHHLLRYGENPHQQAGVYRPRGSAPTGLAGTTPLQGKPLSFNNLLDADAAWKTISSLGRDPACVIVKHGNPCGVARGKTIEAAYDRAFACDPTSAFGGIIAFNHALDETTARAIVKRQFVEVILAPRVEDDALAVLADKPNVRVLAPQPRGGSGKDLQLRQIDGGWLVQQADTGPDPEGKFRVVTHTEPDDAQWRDLLFAWQVARDVRSNAIVYARDESTLGIGAGQMSRVDSARIAAWKAADANLPLTGAVMASDAFFPFADSIETAAEHGIAAIIQPGGSIRDEEVIEACNNHSIAMVLTGRRHFRH